MYVCCLKLVIHIHKKQGFITVIYQSHLFQGFKDYTGLVTMAPQATFDFRDYQLTHIYIDVLLMYTM